MDEKQQVVSALAAALPDLDQATLAEKIERPKDNKNGDYAFPTFFLVKSLHKARQLIAQELVAKVDSSGFERFAVVGPYINFFLDKSKLGGNVLMEILADP